ncbi:TlpA disulfide reductase family protein [Robertkochia solimangrovi]|uniref:TlpA disulfide reductase family protein n=1 Tax=Robertkochia solimangrovi TaxID=2213046 RepID=UPI00117F0FDE|nr:TlpA disulfide reductase family protein [Robertkochia solimangrovi]TRZ42720.1 hypothetical protein DMZ48_11640 [Robertkochia solimangrovi]
MRTIKTTILTSAVLLSLAACNTSEDKGLQLGSLYLSDAKPKAGEELVLKYQGEKPEESFYYYAVNEKFYPADVEFKKMDSLYQASIKVPDSAGILSFTLKSENGQISNDKKGFIVPVYGTDGKITSDADLQEVLYKWRYKDSHELEVNTDSLAGKVASAFAANPELKDKYFITYASLFARSSPETAKPILTNRIDELLSKEEISQKDYEDAATLYVMNGKRQQYDSLNTVIAEKFPESNAAKMAFFKDFNDPENSKEDILEKYKERFGSDMYSNYMNSTLARVCLDSDPAKCKAYIDEIDGPVSKASAINNVAWTLAESGKKLEFAEEISKESLDIIEKEIASPTTVPSYASPKQYKKNLESSYGMYADTYALILFKQGKVKEAINYQKKALDVYSSPDAAARYVEFLMADEQYQTVESEASKMIEENKATADTKKYLKEAFIANGKDAAAFDSYLAELEAKGHASLVAEVKKEMMDEEAHPFTLKNIKGEMIDLATLKGKTVVLDFWATWCGPCKASFPGMQKAVEKFKDHENVVFLFIDTMESGTDEERVNLTSEFITANNYSFNVVLDQTVEEGSRDFQVASDYGVTGIPTKIIIGPDGKIKFESVGFGGSSEKLVDELSIMIELAGS